MNRPEARNALSPDMLVGLADGFDYIDETPEIRCAILTGAGGHFSSGADLKAMGTPSESEHVRNRMAESPNLHWKALLRDYRLSKPLIAAVEGYAVAGGTEMLQGTDIRVAGERRDLRRVGRQARPVPARWLRDPAPPPDPVHDRDGHPPQLAPGQRGRGEGVRAHRSRRPDGTALDAALAIAAQVGRVRAALDPGDPARRGATPST